MSTINLEKEFLSSTSNVLFGASMIFKHLKDVETIRLSKKKGLFLSMTEKIRRSIPASDCMQLSCLYMTNGLLYCLDIMYNGRVSSTKVNIHFRSCLRYKNYEQVPIITTGFFSDFASVNGITTTRLRAFRLRHFVYRHFVYYDFPC